MKIKDFSSAIDLFVEASITHGDATESGDYKIANKNYDKIVKSTTWLRKENKIDQLLQFLNHPNNALRLWSAAYLLPLYEKEASHTLNQIAKAQGLVALDAEMTLKEWKKGTLKL